MSAPVRVMFLSSCVRGGGAGWSLYHLLAHLDRARVEPVVVVPTEGIFAERFAELGVRVVALPLMPERTAQQRFAAGGRLAAGASYSLNLMDSARLVPALARLARREHVDLIYSNNMMLEPIGALAAQLAPLPCVLHARNLHEGVGAQLLYCQAAARLPAVRRVIANSEATAVPYRQAVEGKTVVIHNGIDLARYTEGVALSPGDGLRARLGLSPDDVVVCFTGNLIPRKGLDVLIDAAAIASATRPGLHVVAIGRVPVGNRVDHRAGYEAQVARLGLRERFHFAGFVDDVRAAVADAQMLVLPSRQEPFGRSIIEAMALGTPVIASRVGGIVEIVDDGQTGLLVAPEDAADLAAAIGRLADDAAERMRLAEAARAAIQERFDLALLTRRIEDVIVECAGPARAAA